MTDGEFIGAGSMQPQTEQETNNYHYTALQETSVVISRAFRPGENPEAVRAAGDVLPRTCIARMGVTACSECVYYEQYPADAAEARICSERNLGTIIEEQGLTPEEVLLVSVTANGVGFYDSLKPEDVTINEFGGYEQVKGFNSFFARASEKKALGSRLADCAHFVYEADLPDGDQMVGFTHITRTNMEGVGAESFGDGDKKVNFLAHTAQQASEHYGIPVSAIRVKLTAAIDKLVYKFSSKEGEPTPEEKMDTAFAGWYDMGLLKNVSNPDWQRGDPIEPTDVWEGDYHGMCEHLAANSGLPSENIDMTEVVNPGTFELGHSSNVAGKHGKRPESRDLYLAIAR